MIQDIYDGKILQTWRDSDLIYMSFGCVTLCFTQDELSDVSSDLVEFLGKMKSIIEPRISPEKSKIQGVIMVPGIKVTPKGDYALKAQPNDVKNINSILQNLVGTCITEIHVYGRGDRFENIRDGDPPKGGTTITLKKGKETIRFKAMVQNKYQLKTRYSLKKMAIQMKENANKINKFLISTRKHTRAV